MQRTLPQQLYLLGYDLDRGRFTGGRFRGQLMRAAALTELTVDGQLHEKHGKAAPSVAVPPADPFLAAVLADVPPGRPRSWRGLVQRRAHAADATVRGQLTDLGVIEIRQRRLLGVLPANRVTVPDPEPVRLLRDTARRAVSSEAAAHSVPPREAALAVLAAAGELSSVFSRGERRAHKGRLQELGEQLGGGAPGLRKAITAIRAAVASSGGG